MDEINLWKTGPGREFAPLESVAQLETELQLEDILAVHPELLDGGIELVGRQTPAAVYDEWLRYWNEPPAE